MDHKLLTIAIPTYNRAKYLKRALGSVVSQYDERIEILVSDNASEDNTSQVVESFLKSVPIRYVRNDTNIGLDANFLQCYRLAEGDYMLLLGDDDLIIEHRLATVLDFLENNPQSVLVFINHIFIWGEYIDADHYIRLHSRDKTNRVGVSKRELIDYAKERIGFMSSLVLSMDAVRKIDRPERYQGTSFVHTCLGFEATKDDDASLGIIGEPCVVDDLGDDPDRMNEEASINPGVLYKAFGKRLEYVLTTIGSQYGYDQKQLASVWKNAISSWPNKIIVMKATGQGYRKEEFDQYARPVLKKYPLTYLKIGLTLFIPDFVARWMYKYIRPFYRKLKVKMLGSGQ